MKIPTQVLEYLHTHPQQVTLIRRGYSNVIAFALSDQVIFPCQAELFPEERLNAFRLPDDFIVSNQKLVRWLAELIAPDDPQVPEEIWMTTSHISGSGHLFIEVSFE
ncbi:hypothetical protein [Lacticaseibacillus mingshuiensis]|uniref:Uncharacterized protein n=1 Tax=Lacticaseibacillus mingshuiensis TaxID=2799574 RepID=A0ABW4CKZ1_9LACO|nr:hypothetical protein [Lacticaseibacillus mingshuiensis]